MSWDRYNIEFSHARVILPLTLVQRLLAVHDVGNLQFGRERASAKPLIPINGGPNDLNTLFAEDGYCAYRSFPQWRKIKMFEEKIERNDLEKMPSEYVNLLGRVLTIQADCEIGGPHLYVKD